MDLSEMPTQVRGTRTAVQDPIYKTVDDKAKSNNKRPGRPPKYARGGDALSSYRLQQMQAPINLLTQNEENGVSTLGVSH